jgi:hypothetical protein
MGRRGRVRARLGRGAERGGTLLRLTRTLAAAALALLAACSPAVRRGAAPALAAAFATDRARPAPSPTEDPFLEGLPLLAAAAAERRGAPPDAADAPRAERLPQVEAELRAALRARGTRLTALFVRATSVVVPAAPGRVAAFLADAAAEGASLGADEAEDVGPDADGGRRLRVALLGLGEAPFKADARWAFSVASRTRPDGVVLVRYDVLDDPPPQKITVFVGVAVLETVPGGTRWTEILAVGTPSFVPFFLVGKAHEEATRLLVRRVERLAAKAK